MVEGKNNEDKGGKMSIKYKDFKSRLKNERIDIIFYGLKELDPKMRIIPLIFYQEANKKGQQIPYLTDTWYTLEEFNREIDLFEKDLKNIRGEAKRLFGLWKKYKEE